MKHLAAQLLGAVSILNRSKEVKQTKHDSWTTSLTNTHPETHIQSHGHDNNDDVE